MVSLREQVGVDSIRIMIPDGIERRLTGSLSVPCIIRSRLLEPSMLRQQERNEVLNLALKLRRKRLELLYHCHRVALQRQCRSCGSGRGVVSVGRKCRSVGAHDLRIISYEARSMSA
jgi:hypothetical protein